MASVLGIDAAWTKKEPSGVALLEDFPGGWRCVVVAPPLRLLPEPRRGVHPSTAQKMLGHSDIRMTLAIYTHGTDGMQDAATAALESAFN
jgi:hypothetical protein